jgi:SAM-dependent methyltransferase
MKLTPQAEFWKNPETAEPEGIEPPPDGYREKALPEYWADQDDLSKYLVKVVKKYLPPPALILEPGCGSGRNLYYFDQAGYGVSGIEINDDAWIVAAAWFGEIEQYMVLGSVEDVLPSMDADAIVTQGFLMHLPDGPSTEAVFDVMAGTAFKLIVTNEVEKTPGFPDYRFMRNYREVFERRGWKQVERMYYAPPMGNSTTRVFERE